MDAFWTNEAHSKDGISQRSGSYYINYNIPTEFSYEAVKYVSKFPGLLEKVFSI